MGMEHDPAGTMARYREKRDKETKALYGVLLDAPLTDDADLRSWLGSQDVIGTTVTAQIAGVVHAVLRLREAVSREATLEEALREIARLHEVEVAQRHRPISSWREEFGSDWVEPSGKARRELDAAIRAALASLREQGTEPSRICSCGWPARECGIRVWGSKPEDNPQLECAERDASGVGA